MMTSTSIAAMMLTVAVVAWCAALGGCTAAGRAQAGISEAPLRQATIKGRWAIVVHGGAGMLDKNMSEEQKEVVRAGVTAAVLVGEKILAAGGSSLDAAEAAVRVLEDHEYYNAGRGAVLTRDGTCELDASIMEGRELRCGAVAGARTIRNPISFARRVMQETPHVLFAADGAERLADKMGVERVDPSYFITPRRKEQLERRLKELSTAPSEEAWARGAGHSELMSGTVGCVAFDMNGDLAAATSTGGMTAKIPGRIGDSPIIGAGCYANNTSVAVSSTGTGEQYIRHVAAHELSSLIRYAGMGLDDAMRTVLNQRLEPDDGGMIAIDREGRIAAMMTTGCMPRAWSDSSGNRMVGVWDGDDKPLP